MIVQLSRDLRRRSTAAERVLWEWLRDRRFDGHKFRRQHPIGPFIADFFCAEAALVIELDGEIHNEPARVERDGLRDQAMLGHRLTVLRIRNEDLLINPDAVKEKIRAQLARSLSSRQTLIPGPSPGGEG
jgi:very-short-patch-repair endonuclease